MPDDILEYWSSLSRDLAARFNIEQFEASSDLWNWDNFASDIRTLRGRLGVGEDYIDILRMRVDLDTGKTHDTLTNKDVNTSQIIPHLYYYSKAKDIGVANEWVKFNTLRGSWACRYSFNEENLGMLASVYTKKKENLFGALEQLGAKRVDYGDAGFEVSFLPMVKALLVLEAEDEEFTASVRLLYDKNSIFYLPHEQLGSISWLLARRALQALG
jgi:hypothetical protein